MGYGAEIETFIEPKKLEQPNPVSVSAQLAAPKTNP
jgi:hypothetical protein